MEETEEKEKALRAAQKKEDKEVLLELGKYLEAVVEAATTKESTEWVFFGSVRLDECNLPFKLTARRIIAANHFGVFSGCWARNLLPAILGDACRK